MDQKTDFSVALAAEDAGQPWFHHTFDVTPGRPHELRLRLIDRQKAAGQDLVYAGAKILFTDAKGQEIQLQTCGGHLQIPDLDPLKIEVLAGFDGSDHHRAAGLCCRYFIPPPRAVYAHLIVEWPQDQIDFLDCNPMAVNWIKDGQQVINSVRTSSRFRQTFVQDIASVPPEKADSLTDIIRIPVNQMTAIVDQFKPAGDWEPVLSRLDGLVDGEAEDAGQRRKRLGAQTRKRLAISFVGSDRGFARLSCLADLYLIREAEFEQQLGLAGFDRLIIETTTEPLCGEWRHQLSTLSGTLTPKGQALCASAKAQGVPICLFVTSGPMEFYLWRDFAKIADTVIIEGVEKDWSGTDLFGIKPTFIRPATEPAANPALRGTDADLRLLVPTASDVFNDPEFAGFLQDQTSYDTLFTEYHYDFVARPLKERLPEAPFHAARALYHTRMTKLMQESRLVLVPGSSLRSNEQLLALLLDAISCGSIPILFGATSLDHPIIDSLEQVYDISELQELQRIYRVQWHWEDRWRSLFRKVCEDHVWKSEDRTALLGEDPFGPDHDTPLMTAIIVSKRPQLVASCIEAFRRQTAARKELIIVLNMSTKPEDLPPLAENEHVFQLPPNCTVGQCLNAAIAEATGRYWTKMDDDDFYIDTYLADLRAYFRATQADCLGRQAVYFYFDGPKQSLARDFLARRCFRLARAGNYLSGATLSGDKAAPSPEFSDRFRNAADSSWVETAHDEGYRVISFDSSSLTVFRNADERFHTWKMPDLQNGPRRLSELGSGNIHKVLNGSADSSPV